MRIASRSTTRSVLLSVLLAATGCGDGTAPGGAAAPAGETAAAPTPPPAAPQSEPVAAAEKPLEGVAAARKLLGEMVEAYASAPALVDRVTITSTMGGQERPPIESQMVLGAGTDMMITTARNELVVKDGFMHVGYPHIPDRYLKVPLEGGDVIDALRRTFGTYGGTMAQCALRYRKPEGELIFALAHGLPDQAKLSTARTIVSIEGETLEQLSLISALGAVAINVDPETKLIKTVELEHQVPDSPLPSFRVRRLLEFEPKVLPAPPEPIAFDPGERIAVSEYRILQGMATPESLGDLTFRPGEIVPDFPLHSLTGEKFELSAARGSIVVLGFWAGWNEDSRRICHVLQEVAIWAESSDVPVVMHPINIMGSRTPGRAWEMAYDYWERHDFPFNSLIDESDSIPKALGVTGVPMILVIDPAGRFVGGAAGLPACTTQWLQTQVQSAAEAGG
jgi:hypothetical protein